jgi:hypothetical protein
MDSRKHKPGDVRGDGKVFWAYQKRPGRVYEYWTSPSKFAELMAKRQEASRKADAKKKAIKALTPQVPRNYSRLHEMFPQGTDPNTAGDPKKKIGVRSGRSRRYFEPIRPCDVCGKLYRPDSDVWKKGGCRTCNIGCANRKHQVFPPGTNPDTAGNPKERICIRSHKGGVAYYEPVRTCPGCGKAFRPSPATAKMKDSSYCTSGCFMSSNSDIECFKHGTNPANAGDPKKRICVRTRKGDQTEYYEPVRECDYCGKLYRPETANWRKGTGRHCSRPCYAKGTSVEIFPNGTNPDLVGNPLERICVKARGRGLQYYEPMRPCLFCNEPFRPHTAYLKMGRGKYCSITCFGASRYEENRRDMTLFEKRRTLALDCRRYIQLAMGRNISASACFRVNGWTPAQLREHLQESLRIEHPERSIKDWGNRDKTKRLEVDHIRPVASFSRENPDTPISVINALSNLRLLPARENNRKGAVYNKHQHTIVGKFWITLPSN